MANTSCLFTFALSRNGTDFFQKLNLVFKVFSVPLYVPLFRFNAHIRVL